MDAMGPFNSISGTLMSIPFWIAATLLYVIPDMKRMTTYDSLGQCQITAHRGNMDDCSIRAFALKPRAFGAPLGGVGA